MLEIEGYKKLVGFNIQSGGYVISINDVTDREGYYHFMLELKQDGVVKDYIAIRLLKETRKGDGIMNWYRLEPVHTPKHFVGRNPLPVLKYEVENMKLFGELVCKYGRQVWEI